MGFFSCLIFLYFLIPKKPAKVTRTRPAKIADTDSSEPVFGKVSAELETWVSWIWAWGKMITWEFDNWIAVAGLTKLDPSITFGVTRLVWSTVSAPYDNFSDSLLAVSSTWFAFSLTIKRYSANPACVDGPT